MAARTNELESVRIVGESTAPSEAVVQAVADAEGVSPLALDEPLYASVDTDALDALCSGASTVTTVRFTYLGYVVEVGADGRVSLLDDD